MNRPDSVNLRRDRLKKRLREKYRAECEQELAALESRADYRPELGSFIALFRDGFSPKTVEERVGRRVVNLSCLQAPVELFHALNLHPYKVFGGSAVAGRMAAPSLPALVCPMIRAMLGALELENEAEAARPWVLPCTCDWMAKLGELDGLCGGQMTGPVHRPQLPRLKESPASRKRWLEEILALRAFLEHIAGRALTRRGLQKALLIMQEARRAFTRLILLRRAGRVPHIWFVLISNAFFLDRPENWTLAVNQALPGFTQAAGAPLVHLLGSPVFFPDFKLPRLLESAGLAVSGDDFCSSERIFPRNVAVADPSESGLLTALAESYHQGCLCPVFADSDRRAHPIVEGAEQGAAGGVISVVLKGCHPCDLESYSLEQSIRKAGLKFLRLETDHGPEDSQNLATRLEAFRHTLEAA